MTADAGSPVPPDGDAVPMTDARRALRAQLLATEHWSLLASRSTTQSEVLTRIAIFLTLVSVGLFALGVMGNATQFRGWFGVAALGVLLMLVILGVITALRVFNVGTEDAAYVLAMNRLRGAYVDLDPGIERYLVMSPADDEPGLERTYFPFASRARTQVLASTMMLILVVESVLIGLFVGSLAYALSAPVGWAVAIGAVFALASLALWMWSGYRSYLQVWRAHTPLRTTPTRAPSEPSAPRPASPAGERGTPAPAASAQAVPTPSSATPVQLGGGGDGGPPLRRSRRRPDGPAP
ncbi:MAG TPA: hypothetical protein VFY91_10750 [Microbacterium sp.]|nr:hypothetical protein [Microbacterium sp.]